MISLLSPILQPVVLIPVRTIVAMEKKTVGNMAWTAVVDARSRIQIMMRLRTAGICARTVDVTEWTPVGARLILIQMV